MAQITLPHRRAYVISFWLVLTSLMAAGTWLAGLAAGFATAWIYGVLVASLMLLPRLFTARYFALGVSAWNHATRMLFRMLRGAAIRLSFYVTFPLLQRSGTSMDLVPPGFSQGPARTSTWHIKSDAAQRAMLDAVRGGAWLSDLTRHARETGNWWLLSLIPLIFTLTLVGEEIHDTAPPTSTYTLY